MPIRIQCDACGASLKIEDHLAGTSGVCPSCFESFMIPRESAESAEPPIAATNSDTGTTDLRRAPDHATDDSASEAGASEAGTADDGEFDPLAVLMQEDAPVDEKVSAAADAAPSATTAASPPGKNPPSGQQSQSTDAQGRRVISTAPAARVPRSAAKRVDDDGTSVTDILQDNWRLLVPFSLLALLVLYVYFWPDTSRVRTYPVQGRVLFADGSPVKTGKIEILSARHKTTSAGRIHDDGTFQLGTYENNDGAPEGSHQAIIIQKVINDGTIKHVVDHGKPVDTKFSRYESSGLTVSIEPVELNDIVLRVTATKRPAKKLKHTH